MKAGPGSPTSNRRAQQFLEGSCGCCPSTICFPKAVLLLKQERISAVGDGCRFQTQHCACREDAGPDGRFGAIPINQFVEKNLSPHRGLDCCSINDKRIRVEHQHSTPLFSS